MVDKIDSQRAAGELSTATSPAGTDIEKDAPDENLVDWDDPDDPENPLNWPHPRKLLHVIIATAISFPSNLAGTSFAPAAPSLADDFLITNPTVSAFTVSIHMLGFGLGPLVIAPLSEHYGRFRIYASCQIVFIVFLIACSEADDVSTFLACRLIAGLAGSGPGAIGGGTIADVMTQEKRGAAMAIFGLGPILGMGIGPVMGGFVTQQLGWRWIFRILCIAAGVIMLVFLCLTRETYHSAILQRKAARLRMRTGNDALYSKYDNKDSTVRALWHAVRRPAKLLIFSPIAWFLAVYAGFVWGLLILLFTTFPAVYFGLYGFDPGVSGLSYLGIAVGMAVGAASFGVLSDRMTRKLSGGDNGQESGECKPETRLKVMIWLTPVLPIGMFWYGWSAFYEAHWIVPILGTTFIGVGSLYILMPVQLYLVDAFGPTTAASALAGNTVVRAVYAGFLPLAGPVVYDSLGLGWGNTLLGFIIVGFCVVPPLLYRYGEWMRTKWRVDV